MTVNKLEHMGRIIEMLCVLYYEGVVARGNRGAGARL